QLQQVVKHFFEGGGRVIDTSPNYGRSDTVLGSLLADGGWRKQCFLATKIAADSREAAEAQWAESLRRLRTDHVELLQVHNLRDWKRQLPYARELKAQGRTKYVGVTHYTDAGLPELEQVLRSEALDFIQIHYSVNSAAAAKTVLPLALDRGVAVIINRAFDDGRLFAKVRDTPLPAWAADVGVSSWAQLCLKVAISHPAVTVVIPATGKPERQRDQLEAGTGPLLDTPQQPELLRRASACAAPDDTRHRDFHPPALAVAPVRRAAARGTGGRRRPGDVLPAVHRLLHAAAGARDLRRGRWRGQPAVAVHRHLRRDPRGAAAVRLDRIEGAAAAHRALGVRRGGRQPARLRRQPAAAAGERVGRARVLHLGVGDQPAADLAGLERACRRVRAGSDQGEQAPDHAAGRPARAWRPAAAVLAPDRRQRRHRAVAAPLA